MGAEEAGAAARWGMGWSRALFSVAHMDRPSHLNYSVELLSRHVAASIYQHAPSTSAHEVADSYGIMDVWVTAFVADSTSPASWTFGHGSTLRRNGCPARPSSAHRSTLHQVLRRVCSKPLLGFVLRVGIVVEDEVQGFGSMLQRLTRLAKVGSITEQQLTLVEIRPAGVEPSCGRLAVLRSRPSAARADHRRLWGIHGVQRYIFDRSRPCRRQNSANPRSTSLEIRRNLLGTSRTPDVTWCPCLYLTFTVA